MTAAVLRGGDAGRLLRVCSFGGDLVPYVDGLRLQQRLAQLCKERAIPDTLLLLQVRPRSQQWRKGANQAMTLLSAAADPGCARPCGQHAPVYTLGKRGSSKDFRTAPEALQAAGAEVHRSERGGEVTYHGPGQASALRPSYSNTRSAACSRRSS
jgi:hypothetical protein